MHTLLCPIRLKFGEWQGNSIGDPYYILFLKKRALDVPNESIKYQNMTLQLHTQKNNTVTPDVYEYMISKIETCMIL